ncbi:MAG: hypothetical protein QOJ42_2766 [Acidobacteriaceae bacterium]|jgi:hypothetical protein|nr:hypothetical protein [Acidobacteriaceae bacterium]
MLTIEDKRPAIVSLRGWARDFKSLASTSSATPARVVFSTVFATRSTDVLQEIPRVLQNRFLDCPNGGRMRHARARFRCFTFDRPGQACRKRHAARANPWEAGLYLEIMHERSSP